MKQIKRVKGKIILGDGELSGHAHTIRDPQATLWAVDEETMQLKLPRAAKLRHEKGDQPAEHRDIHLPAGEPIVTHKRRYDPEQGWARVVD